MSLKINKLAVLALLVVASACFFVSAYKVSSQSNVDVIEKGIELERAISNLTTYALSCPARCSPESLSDYFETLDVTLSHFKNAAANERDYIQTAGSFDIHNLDLHIELYKNNRNLKDLVAIAKFRNSLREWRISSVVRHRDTELQSLYNIFVMGLICILIAVILSLIDYQYQSSRRSHYYDRIAKEKELSIKIKDDLSAGNSSVIAEALNDTSMHTDARTIYSSIQRLYQSIEDTQMHIDLYASLYKVIGFEIRALSNTIKGGLKVLVSEASEEVALLGTEINTATDTLESLAENFDQIFSVTNASTKQDTIQLIKMINEIALSVSSKCRRNDKIFECYVDRTLPLTIHGSPVNFYWLLLLHISNVISSLKHDCVFLKCYTTSSSTIDHVGLTLEIVNFKDIESPFNEISAIDWQEADNETDNRHIARSLVDDSTTFETHQFSHGDQFHRFVMNIDISPDLFDAPKKILDGRKFLVCGSSSLQVSVLSNILNDYYGQVEAIEKPSELFRNIKIVEEYDAVMLTDTVQGIELGSFCKTLRTRMKKLTSPCKLILSVSSPDVAAGVYEHVDHTFYRPNDNRQFALKLEEIINSDAEDTAVESTRALVVDDDPVQQFILSDMLSSQGLTVDTVGSGEDAIEHYVTNQTPLIFMDCIMPGMGGIAATGKIRQLNHEPKPTIIGATALTSAAEHKQCIDGGMDYVISKPYKDEEIVKILKKFMAVSKVS